MPLPSKSALLAHLSPAASTIDTACSICYEPFSPPSSGDAVERPHRAVQTPCTHTFGHTCLLQWLDQAHTCPTCRRPLYDPNSNEQPDANDEEALLREADALLQNDAEASLQLSMQQLNLHVHVDDLLNRRKLLSLFAALIAEVRRPSGDIAEIARLERSITVLNQARLVKWQAGELELKTGQFRSMSQGMVEKGAFVAEGEMVVVDGVRVSNVMGQYLNCTLTTALYELLGASFDGVEGMALHPVALMLVEEAMKWVGGVRGRRYDVAGLRREVQGVLEAKMPQDAPWGLDAVMFDVIEIAVVASCGMPARVFGLDYIGHEVPEIGWMVLE